MTRRIKVVYLNKAKLKQWEKGLYLFSLLSYSPELSMNRRGMSSKKSSLNSWKDL